MGWFLRLSVISFIFSLKSLGEAYCKALQYEHFVNFARDMCLLCHENVNSLILACFLRHIMLFISNQLSKHLLRLSISQVSIIVLFLMCPTLQSLLTNLVSSLSWWRSYRNFVSKSYSRLKTDFGYINM